MHVRFFLRATPPSRERRRLLCVRARALRRRTRPSQGASRAAIFGMNGILQPALTPHPEGGRPARTMPMQPAPRDVYVTQRDVTRLLPSAVFETSCFEVRGPAAVYPLASKPNLSLALGGV